MNPSTEGRAPSISPPRVGAALHVATVGNDPAPVALGYLHACSVTPVTETLLVLDSPRDEVVRARQQALQAWVSARRGQARPCLLEELAGMSLSGGTLNLTGGSKPSVRPLFEQALGAGAGVFTVDAHGQRLTIHDIVAGQALSVTVHLTADDYRDLYLPAAVQDIKRVTIADRPLPDQLRRILNAPETLPFLKIPAPETRGMGGPPLGAWLLVQNSHLYVVWEADAMRARGSLHGRARLLARLTRELGGQLATPVLSLAEFDPDSSGGVGLLDYVTEELGASLVAGGREWRAQPRVALPTDSDLNSAADLPADNVHVILMGAQPMPAIIGVQAQDVMPDRVYLLTTPGVLQTAERVRTVLASAPQLSGSGVHILDIDENRPERLPLALQQVVTAHPDARVALNLTGGTKALALHALKWVAESPGNRQIDTEFTQGQRVAGREPHWHLSLEQELQVRGVRFGPSREVPPQVLSLERAARALFEYRNDRTLAQFREEVTRHLPGQFSAADMHEGLATEYLSITELSRSLPAGTFRHLRWATKLVFPSARRPEGFLREVDGLAVLNDGRLLLLESKRDLVKGIREESETLQMSELAERLSGLHAHAMIVGGCRNLEKVADLGSWEEAIRVSGSLQDAFSLWSLAPQHPPSQPMGVRRFPEDLLRFFSPGGSS